MLFPTLISTGEETSAPQARTGSMLMITMAVAKPRFICGPPGLYPLSPTILYRLCAISACLVIALTAGGCVPGKVRKVDIVGIQSAEVYDIGQDSMDLKVHILLRNPHFTTVRVTNVNFQLGITQEKLGHGQITEPVEIPSDSVKVVAVPLSVRYQDVREEDFQSLFNPQIPYHLVGTLQMDKPVRKSNIKLDTRGTIPAPERVLVKMPDKTIYNLADFGRIKLRDFQPLSGRSVVSVRLNNPFRFSILLQTFDYRFHSNGSVIVDGNMARAKELASGMNVLELPFRLHPLEGFKGLAGSLMDLQLPSLAMIGTLVLGRTSDRTLTIDLEVK